MHGAERILKKNFGAGVLPYYKPVSGGSNSEPVILTE